MRSRTLLIACVACLASATAVLASETVVKNDSVSDFGQVSIVGDFAIGEQAAVWLTAPCTGTIVAVQILWLEGTTGHGPALEDAITIWEGNSFPNPGNILAFLEGPVLTPGGWNEFRYLDEENTVPLNVPVTSGQKFMVGLQFGEPTDVGHGGPSVVRDLDGCQNGRNAIYAVNLGGWFNTCLIVTGDWAIRAVINCPDPSGACCLADGGCVVRTAAQCATEGGTYKGNNTTCATANCPQPTGACCFQATGGCVNLTAANCAGAGGVWGGAGTACATYTCFPKGACCLPDGSCAGNVSPTDCATQGGAYQGNNTLCANVNCPLPQGACCFGTGFCLVLTQADCAQAGAMWKGAATSCADNNSNGVADACEVTACAGDTNCDGLVNFADINPFVAALTTGTMCSFANCDVNHDNAVNFGDINPFVARLTSAPLPIHCN
jgi:hypothetical protein